MNSFSSSHPKPFKPLPGFSPPLESLVHLCFLSYVPQDGYGAGLNMTRSLGDLEAHRETGLIADPECREYQAEQSAPCSRGARVDEGGRCGGEVW